VLTSKHAIKHEHALVWFTIQQLTTLAVQSSLTDRDNWFDRHSEYQRVSAKIMITIKLS
jgi:hypothetical protein